MFHLFLRVVLSARYEDRHTHGTRHPSGLLWQPWCWPTFLTSPESASSILSLVSSPWKSRADAVFATTASRHVSWEEFQGHGHAADPGSGGSCPTAWGRGDLAENGISTERPCLSIRAERGQYQDLAFFTSPPQYICLFVNILLCINIYYTWPSYINNSPSHLSGKFPDYFPK